MIAGRGKRDAQNLSMARAKPSGAQLVNKS